MADVPLPTVKAIQEAMNRFARAHMLLGSASDRDSADKALCDAIKDHAAAVTAAKDAEIAALRAEVAGMREVLREIAQFDLWEPAGPAAARARTALAALKGTT